MSSYAIEIEGVSKAYRRVKARRGDLRSTVASAAGFLQKKDETFLALDQIHLTITTGDTVGIIGPNGAGKSTLLKLLSRITWPTSGTIRIRGRLAAMLEVGTGFHPELTGRENIFLNGALMGMHRREVQKKLESIIDFSGIESFIDTPVKHYSSGMFSRLAFAVSSHLEPDILILDEVLAVGDIAFKRKSLERIQEVSKSGCTILMVSHQLSYLRSFCHTGLYLHDGHVRSFGLFEEAVQTYLSDTSRSSVVELSSRTDRKGTGEVQLTAFRIYGEDPLPTEVLHAGEEIRFQLDIENKEDKTAPLEMRIEIFDMSGRQWFVLNNVVSSGYMEVDASAATFECTVAKWPLNEGHYYVDFTLLAAGKVTDQLSRVAEFTVEKGWFFPTGMLPHPAKGMLVDHEWKKAASE